MTVIRTTVFVAAALATGLGAGAVLAQRLTESAQPAPAAVPAPVEAPVQASKQARLDAGCDRQTWPYIAAECLQRVAVVRQAVPAQPSVTVASRDPQTRTTVLTKTAVLRTASR
jgi:hypothetical protein